MSTQTFEAGSVDKALEEATSALGIAADDLQYEVEEKASDFWGLGDTVYVVTVTLPEADPEPEDNAGTPPEAVRSTATDAQAAPAEATEEVATPAQEDAPAGAAVPSFFSYSEDAPAAEEANENPTSEASAEGAELPVPTPAVTEAAAPGPAGAAETPDAAAPVGGTDLTKEAAGILDGIFAAMGFECAAEAKLDGDTMQVAITGEDNQYLLEGRGRGLAALELILNHSFRSWPDRAHKRVRVDAGDFRSQRDDEIRDMAYQVAHRAKETGSEQQTSELNPYERRIVHLTLAEDHQVTTRSLGNGFLKAVNVIPTSGGQRRDQ